MRISIFDTSVGSLNLGDQIIMEAVNNELASILPNAAVHRAPTHDFIGRYGRRYMSKSDLVFVGGTNLLFSYWSKLRPWKFKLRDMSPMAGKVIIMGSGWSTYSSSATPLAKFVYKKILNPAYAQSVRDNYSKKMLAEATNLDIVNTGCPTLWGLNQEHVKQIPDSLGTSVVTTLTDYSREPELDRLMLETLQARYNDVYFWPQGSGDKAYLTSLNVENIKILNPTLTAYDELLDTHPSLDFVGTRLHAGIRALQKKRRAIIISVDNRAKEMGSDCKLPVHPRESIRCLAEPDFSISPYEIQLNMDGIAKWRKQFEHLQVFN